MIFVCNKKACCWAVDRLKQIGETRDKCLYIINVHDGGHIGIRWCQHLGRDGTNMVNTSSISSYHCFLHSRLVPLSTRTLGNILNMIRTGYFLQEIRKRTENGENILQIMMQRKIAALEIQVCFCLGQTVGCLVILHSVQLQKKKATKNRTRNYLLSILYSDFYHLK